MSFRLDQIAFSFESDVSVRRLLCTFAFRLDETHLCGLLFLRFHGRLSTCLWFRGCLYRFVATMLGCDCWFCARLPPATWAEVDSQGKSSSYRTLLTTAFVHGLFPWLVFVVVLVVKTSLRSRCGLLAVHFLGLPRTGGQFMNQLCKSCTPVGSIVNE